MNMRITLVPAMAGTGTDSASEQCIRTEVHPVDHVTPRHVDDPRSNKQDRHPKISSRRHVGPGVE